MGMIELILVLGAVLTLGLVWAGVRLAGAGGGIAALILGVAVSGLLAVQIGVDAPDNCAGEGQLEQEGC